MGLICSSAKENNCISIFIMDYNTNLQVIKQYTYILVCGIQSIICYLINHVFSQEHHVLSLPVGEYCMINETISYEADPSL